MCMLIHPVLGAAVGVIIEQNKGDSKLDPRRSPSASSRRLLIEEDLAIAMIWSTFHATRLGLRGLKPTIVGAIWN